MAHFAVTYHYGADTATQDAHRPEHRAFLGSLAEQGFVVASGPLPGTGTALLVVRASDDDQVRRVLSDDPFQRLGQVERVEVQEWNPVIGILA